MNDMLKRTTLLTLNCRSANSSSANPKVRTTSSLKTRCRRTCASLRYSRDRVLGDTDTMCLISPGTMLERGSEMVHLERYNWYRAADGSFDACCGNFDID
jgi:hypothetical protein